jgi:drug/metabolite transporter (DMT)-like permease
MIRDELSRLATVEERHRRLFARFVIALGATLVVAFVGTLLTYHFELGVKGGDVHDLADAAFFTIVQLLTVSSQIKNPLTTGGRIVDVALEAWSIFVVTAVAGSFASFFSASDSS